MGEKVIDIEEQFNLIAQNIIKPKKVLDLGAGTGILSMFWYKHFPEAEYMLVDIANEMLNVARSRFGGLKNVSCQVLDYTKELPADNFDVIMSALSMSLLQ